MVCCFSSFCNRGFCLIVELKVLQGMAFVSDFLISTVYGTAGLCYLTKISRHYHSITIKMLWFTFTLHVINIPGWLGIYCVYILYTLLYISSNAIWRRSGKRSNKRYGVSINIYYIKSYICWNTYVTRVHMLHILKVGSSSTAN